MIRNVAKLSWGGRNLLLHHVEADVSGLAVDCREHEDRNGHESSGDEHSHLATKDWDSIHHGSKHNRDDTGRVDSEVVAVSGLDRQAELAVLCCEDGWKVVACKRCQQRSVDR